MKKFITFCSIAFALLHGVHSAKAQIFDRRISNELQNAGIITTVAQDHQGYIWISSSAAGLIRYDGSKVISITNNPQVPNSLASNWVENVVIDLNDIIWLGTRAGLDRYDPSNNTFTHYRHNIKDSGSLSNDTVTALIQDRDGNIWVGTRKGLNTLNAKTGKFTHYYNKVNDPASLSYNDVIVLYEDRQGVVWVGCGSPFYEHEGKPADGGLNRFDKQTGKFKRYLHEPGNPNSIENNKVKAILEDKKGNFWIGTAGDGLHTLDRATGTFTHYHYDSAHPESLSRPPVQNHPWGLDHITFIHEDAKGLVWIGTLAGGINQYDPVTKKVTHYGFIGTPDKIIKADTLSGFKNFQSWHAFTSKDGLLWISALGEVYTINTNPRSFIPYFKTKQRNVNTFYQEKNGSLWIGTDTGLIHKDITGKEEIFLKNPHDKHGLNNNIVTSIQPDNEGKLWLATYRGGINIFDPLTQTFTHYVHDAKTNSLSSNNVNNLLFDHNGTLWAATDSGLNSLDNKSGLFTAYTHNAKDSNSLGENSIFCLLESGDYLWLGTTSGVERFNKTNGKFKHYLFKNNIKSLFIDKDGVLWAGAWLGPSDGLHYYDKVNDRFIFYTPADGNIKISRIGNIIGDNQNNLWVSSYNAIYKISPNRNDVTIYGNEYGVHIDSFAWATNYKTRNGKLLLGDQGGYYAFFPEQITTGTSPQIYITSFQLGDKEIVPGKGSAFNEPLYKANRITLKYNQSSFSISFWATHYTSAGEEKYWYKLENYDTVWHDGANNKAYFFNLPPGNYVFHVKAMNSDGVWSEKKLPVIISPPWWQTWWALTLLALAVITIAWTFYYYRSRKLRKENQLLEEKVNRRTIQLQQSLEELKSTQTQLIQSEKMASLGGLTAGIAHEIQNPLNFVNNFSEVNKELLDEMENELNAGNKQEAISIAKDIRENEEKINHHGKRADAIVKGMLQHSRNSSGQKEPTDINVLADEYLRLSYQGLRAKDKTFNATLQTDFDKSIGKINIIPQDIGRVLLNLYNNSFYEVAEKKKQADKSYEPIVTVSTKKVNGKVEVRINDNGNGIPQKVLDKIFHPFFTTKPTGQGTGLGLSLSYDIIKAHGGEIKADTREHEFAEFVIQLPITA